MRNSGEYTQRVSEMEITVRYCTIYNCPTCEACCDRKDEYGCPGCDGFTEIPKFLEDKYGPY